MLPVDTPIALLGLVRVGVASGQCARARPLWGAHSGSEFCTPHRPRPPKRKIGALDHSIDAARPVGRVSISTRMRCALR
jgi:hypothetical protein